MGKDGGGKDLFSPATIPLNCNTPIIDRETEEQKTKSESTKLSDLTEEEIRTYFYLFEGPRSPTGSKSDESESKESETEESEDEGCFIGIQKKRKGCMRLLYLRNIYVFVVIPCNMLTILIFGFYHLHSFIVFKK
ncbi:uncharacterized protein LOC110749739 [Prunus avium]|uniref:Uncharacterized protein LOC110749739 n=1 Tax=Prunus avium TaxID=42229 RepID=A0A6P5RWV8_PRUAV|nr:uncharacterized protein LOC110749739 [Prunus avium]